jgi:hypothetical protein
MITSDFTATRNPFNQNLNYEKILRFSNTKVMCFFYKPKIFAKKISLFVLKILKKGFKVNFIVWKKG